MAAPVGTKAAHRPLHGITHVPMHLHSYVLIQCRTGGFPAGTATNSKMARQENKEPFQARRVRSVPVIREGCSIFLSPPCAFVEEKLVSIYLSFFPFFFSFFFFFFSFMGICFHKTMVITKELVNGSIQAFATNIKIEAHSGISWTLSPLDDKML